MRIKGLFFSVQLCGFSVFFCVTKDFTQRATEYFTNLPARSRSSLLHSFSGAQSAEAGGHRVIFSALDSRYLF
jgi:hypothetical protein